MGQVGTVKTGKQVMLASRKNICALRILFVVPEVGEKLVEPDLGLVLNFWNHLGMFVKGEIFKLMGHPPS